LTTKCPRCFRTLSADLFAWECAGTCQPMPDPIASANAGIQVLSRPLVKMQRPSDHRRWLPPADQPCSKCHQPSRDVCPYCHYDLLRNWRESDTVTIALAGARATGKTIYVAILVKQLEEMFSRNRLALSFADQRSRKIYEEHYEAPLYEARGIPGPTAPAQVEGAYQRDPIILDMGSLRTGPAMLVIRDVAGEDLERPAADPRYLSYFERADIVLFLFDPSAVRDVRELLKDYLPQEDRITGDPEVVLENLLRLMGASPVPTGMILSKFDTMQALAGVQDQQWSRIMSNAGAAFARDPGINNWQYDRTDGDLLHEEVHSLLNQLHAQKFVNTLAPANQRFKREYRFFTVSALGEAVIGDKLHSRGIASFRCLDPIRWVLARQGVA
jgi:Double-GTPase 2